VRSSLVGSLLILLWVASASAQPVTVKLDGAVPVGQKPTLEVRANEKLAGIQLDAERGDGRRFKASHGALAKGQAIKLPIGDGAAGKASYKATLSVRTAGAGTWTEQLTFDTLVSAPIKVTYDADHLDLDRRVLQFQVSRPIDRAELAVFGEDGKPIGNGSATFTGSAANTWLSISWTQPEGARVMTMKLRVAAADGAATNVELIPWSVTIEHDDVNFDTDSAVIAASETAKLDASLARINEVVKRSERFVKMRLYIAGHTDTVGASAKNRKLSLDRAAAIAKYFRQRGLALPIAIAGFGEDVLKVATPDNTDERANRRADYVIGPAAGAPPFKGPYLKARASWKTIP
jgi:outer membrane protein OmpA-like peptidoglycan-associated protein